MGAALTWSTACLDWRDRIVKGESLIPPPLFPEYADEALALFKTLKIVDAPPKADGEAPTFGEACEQWVFDFVRAIFGAYDGKGVMGKAGRRLIREFFLLISKKNSKSTIAAGIMVTALVKNWRKSAELLLLAPTIEAATNCFNPARDMVQASPDLTKLLHIQEHLRTITNRNTKATLKVVSADSDVVSGKKAAFVLIDELWVFGKRPKADAMLREATGGLVSRPEGFVIYLTTHSDESPAGVFKAKLNYFRGVRDGTILDPKSLGVLYEFPEAMLEAGAYLDPANFHITNPNMGRSVDHEWLVDELGKVVTAVDGTKQVFLAKHLNVEIGLRLSADAWSGARYWEKACDPTLTYAEIKRRCEVCVVGIDGGGLDDLLALTVFGRERGSRRWLSWCHAWVQTDVLELRKEIAPRLLDFVADGDLTVCDLRPAEIEVESDTGETVMEIQPQDFAELVAIVKDLNDDGLLPEADAVGLDPAGVATLVDALEDAGVTADQLHGVPQGYRLQSAIKAGERKLKDRTWRPASQRLTAWSAGNCKVEQRGSAMLITKQLSGVAKIDPTMSAFDGIELMARHPEPSRLITGADACVVV